MKFTLRQLQIFIEIARDQNVSRASKRLHISQSAANEALLNMERTFGFDFFDRQANRLVLNRHGERVLREADKLMSKARFFEEEVLQMKPSLGVKVGASFTIGNHLATRAMAKYLENEPEADIDLVIGSTPDIVAKVADAKVDVGMVEWSFHHQDVLLTPWREDELVVFVSASHPLAKHKVLSRQDISQAKWILREPNSGLGHAFSSAMGTYFQDVTVYLELRHNEAIKTAVESGLGVGCLSRIAIQRDLDRGEVVQLTIPGVELMRRFYFATAKRSANGRAVERWIDVCKGLD